jgi:hypothetical protein
LLHQVAIGSSTFYAHLKIYVFENRSWHPSGLPEPPKSNTGFISHTDRLLGHDSATRMNAYHLQGRAKIK